MKKTILLFSLLLVLLGAIFTAGCTAAVHERIQEGTRLAPLDEMVQARDVALEAQVKGNIQSDLVLRYYAQQYGLTVEGSHAVMTVSMKVKTEEQRDLALLLAKQDSRIQEVIDDIEIDPTLEDTPFAEIWD